MLGCGEYEFENYSVATPSGSLNAGKILEIAMNGGHDPVGGWQIGPQTPKLTECKSFEEFYGYYLRHSRHYIEAEAEFEAYEYEITGNAGVLWNRGCGGRLVCDSKAGI